MSQDQIDILKHKLQTEKRARKAVEKRLEEKSVVLKETSQELEATNKKLENFFDEKTLELQGIFENIVDAHVIMDMDGVIVKFNDAATRLFGYNLKKEFLNVKTLIHKDDYEDAISSFSQLQSKGFLKNYEVRICTKSNEVKWAHINGSVIFNNYKTPIAVQGIIRDITKEREAEEQLIESENRLSTLVLNLDSGVLLEDENRKVVLTNTKFCNLFNIPVAPENLTGEDCACAAEESKGLFYNPEEFVTRIDEIVKRQELVLGDELKMTNGKILERDYIPIYKNAEYKGHLWSYRDVSLKRYYAQRIEAQRQKYSSIIANMKLGLVEVNNDDLILMINQSFAEMSGYTEEELLGKKGSEVFQADLESDIIEIENKKRQEGKSNSYELKAKNKSGEIRHWLISGAPNYDLDGNISGSIGVHLDITDLKSLEFQKEKLLLRLERTNEELQEYAHIVSHDLKSPLRNIYALITWLKEDNKGKLDNTSLQNFTHVETILEKMDQLISDILDYSSAGADNTEKVNVNIDSLIKDLIKIVYIPDHISISIENKLPTLKGDKTKLQQLFQNLISNAVKFIDKPQGEIKINVKSLKGYYEFSISDNGMGIEKKYHDKIFKIFHSLNKSKESTGIGLSIVKKIVDLHEGKVWLESEVNNGTTFYFTIKK